MACRLRRATTPRAIAEATVSGLRSPYSLEVPSGQFFLSKRGIVPDVPFSRPFHDVNHDEALAKSDGVMNEMVLGFRVCSSRHSPKGDGGQVKVVARTVRQA
jgi:hypothetical protein